MASSFDPRSSSSASPRERDAAPGPAAAPAPGAPAPTPTDRRPSVLERRDPRKVSYYKRMRLFVGAFALALAGVVAYVVVVFSPIFEIKSITCNPTEHLTSELISELAAVPGGSTLFGVDEAGVKGRLEANPWVSAVSLRRNLPDELVIEVDERRAAAVVMLANGSQAWVVATDGHWLETVAVQESTADNGLPAPADQARSYASQQGLAYITDVSALVVPKAGEACEDAGVLGALAYLNGFSDALRPQVATMKAASPESLSAVLTNGVEVSLGTPTDIDVKERVILAALEQYAGRLTYLNVRAPAAPTMRALSEEEVAAAQEAAAAAAEQAAADAAAAAADAGAQDGAAQGEAPDAAPDEDAGAPDEAPGADAEGEAGPGGSLDEGGYYGDDGAWVYYYHDPDTGELVYGYYDADGSWVSLA